MTIESAFQLHLVEFVVVFKYICYIVVLWEGCKIGEKEHPHTLMKEREIGIVFNF